MRRTISGNVNITNISLALINPALMKGESAAGMLNANLRTGGSAQKPLVFGRLALDRAKVQGHWMPFDMTDARLAVNFNGMTSTLEGLLSTTRGQLNLAGDADWRDINAACAHCRQGRQAAGDGAADDPHRRVAGSGV